MYFYAIAQENEICFLLYVPQEVSKSRVRRQNPPAQNGELIDNIFNIPITAIRQTAAAAQVFSPENTQTIDNIVKVIQNYSHL